MIHLRYIILLGFAVSAANLAAQKVNFSKEDFTNTPWKLHEVWSRTELVCLATALDPIPFVDPKSAVEKRHPWQDPGFGIVRGVLQIDEVLASKWTRQETRKLFFDREDGAKQIALLDGEESIKRISVPNWDLFPGARYLVFLRLTTKEEKGSLAWSANAVFERTPIFRPALDGFGLIPMETVEGFRNLPSWTKRNQWLKEQGLESLAVADEELPREFRPALWFWKTHDSRKILTSVKSYLSHQSHLRVPGSETDPGCISEALLATPEGQALNNGLFFSYPEEGKMAFPFLNHILLKPDIPE